MEEEERGKGMGVGGMRRNDGEETKGESGEKGRKGEGEKEAKGVG